VDADHAPQRERCSYMHHTLWQEVPEARQQQHEVPTLTVDLGVSPANGGAVGSATSLDDRGMHSHGASRHCIWLGNTCMEVSAETLCSGSSTSSDGESSQETRICRGTGSSMPAASSPPCEDIPWPSLQRPRPPPAPPELPPGVLSLGSQLHGTGECRPCFYRHSKKGCQFGAACVFCHGDHAKKRKARPPKHVRSECRNRAHAAFDQYCEATPELAEAHLQQQEFFSANRAPSKYATVVLRALYRGHAATSLPLSAGAPAQGSLRSGHLPSPGF